MRYLPLLAFSIMSYTVFGQVGEEKIKQTIPLDSLVHVTNIKKTQLKLGTSNVYSFSYRKGRKRVHAKFLVDEDIDSLQNEILDTFVVLKRNGAYVTRQADGTTLTFGGCAIWDENYVLDPADTNKRVLLNFRVNSRSPTLRLGISENDVRPNLYRP